MTNPELSLAYLIARTLPQVWAHLGDDYCPSFPDSDTPNSERIEACLDADRLAIFGGDEGKTLNDHFNALSHGTQLDMIEFLSLYITLPPN